MVIVVFICMCTFLDVNAMTNLLLHCWPVVNRGKLDRLENVPDLVCPRCNSKAHPFDDMRVIQVDMQVDVISTVSAISLPEEAVMELPPLYVVWPGSSQEVANPPHIKICIIKICGKRLPGFVHYAMLHS